MAPRAQDSTRSVVAPVAGLLRRLIAASGSLVEAAAGSVSLVDGSRDRYAKLAERGTSCRLGSSFSLDEGVTGQVVAHRRPVVLATYGQVHAGHLAAGGAAHAGAVLAVPLWWRGDVVGANVVFACRPRRFTLAEVDELELLTQSAVPELVRLGAEDPALTHLLHPPGQQPDAPSPLTRREQETLALLAGGLSNREIAGALVLAPKTVEKHVAEVLRKTGTHSRTAAVMTGLHRGWLPDR
jgi:DNA-binding CsgD family transcriptional regulator